MSRLRYWKGAGVRVTAEFTDPDTEEHVDVAEPVTFTFKKPDDSSQTLAGEKIAKGIYRTAVAASLVGTWNWRAATAGAFPGVDEGSFEVKDTNVGP